jgi:hypothetical protein
MRVSLICSVNEFRAIAVASNYEWGDPIVRHTSFKSDVGVFKSRNFVFREIQSTCAKCSVAISSSENHRRKAERQRERQRQRYGCVLQVRGMLPLEQPKKEEDDTRQVTQACIDRHTKEATFLFCIEPVEMLIYSVVHVDPYEPFRNGVESDPVALAEVASIAELITLPVVQAWAVIEVVVILELLFGDWAIRRRRSRLAGQEVIHPVIVVWESDVHTCASTIAVLMEENEFRILVPPHREPES